MYTVHIGHRLYEYIDILLHFSCFSTAIPTHTLLMLVFNPKIIVNFFIFKIEDCLDQFSFLFKYTYSYLFHLQFL